MTPFPSSSFETFPNHTAESTPWPLYERSSNPDFVTGYNMPPSQFTPNFAQIERPRSSPSSFGPTAEIIPWPDNALGIRYSVPDPPNTTASNFPQTPYNASRQTDKFATSSPPDTQALEAQRIYPTLAPNPAGLAAKRRREEEEEATLQSSSKRRGRTPSASNMSENERFLFALKEEENLPWKEIKARFETDRGEVASIPTLQMRYKRTREKLRVWEARDLEALTLAHEYYEKKKWEIISEEVSLVLCTALWTNELLTCLLQMLKYGITEAWPARYCSKKWQEISPQQPPLPMVPTPGASQYSSPAEGPSRFGYYTMQ